MLTQNPIYQYRLGLVITAIISSLIPVVIYWFLHRQKIKQPFLIALLTGFHPSLFVYSGALMSETFYTLVLIFLSYYFWQAKLNQRNILLMILLLYLLTIIRSAAVVVIIAFYISLLARVWIKKDKKLFFNALTGLVFLILLLLIDQFWLKLRLGHYNEGDYFTRAAIMLKNPIKALLLIANNTFVFIWMMFGLAFVLPTKVLKRIGKNLPIVLFLILIAAGSIILTAVHSARQYLALNNNGYALSFRYLAPYAVLIYNFLLIMVFSHLNKLKINFILFFLFSIFTVVFFENTGWKFANNVSVILLADRSVIKIGVLMIFSVLVFLFLLFCKKLQRFKIVLITVYLLVLSFFMSLPCLNGPRFAKNVYEKEMDLEKLTSENPDRDLFLNRYLKQ